jgi:hypothetical protein
MAHRLPTVAALLFVLVSTGCERKPAAPIEPSGATAAATASDASKAPRWTYRAKVTRDGEAQEAATPDATRELDMVETGRREIAGYRVHDLVVEVAGTRQGPDDLERLGLTAAPFPEFAPHLALVFGTFKGQPAAWLLLSDDAPDADEVRTLVAEDPTWPLAPGAKLEGSPAALRPDDEGVYRKAIGSWPSLCAALQHPSPDTGDYYSYERCLAPEVGLTRLEFDSVWGGHELELVRAPDHWPR